MPETTDRPLLLVLHGARGDLARRMVLPAVHLLDRRGLLPGSWTLLGSGRRAIGDDDFRSLVRDSLDEFGEGGDGGAGSDGVDDFLGHLTYAADGSGDADGLVAAVARERERLGDPLLVHYLAIPPQTFGDKTKQLGDQGLLEDARVVYEKPFGTSPSSFAELDSLVHRWLDEEQIYRIDHFLAKEGTQNLHVLRFANELFGSAWNAEHVSQVQIDVPETLDVADRASFYDATGAALDMLVTHLFQVAAEVALEQPDDLDDGLLAARTTALAAFRALDPERDVVLGQFDGYRDLDGVADDSETETFVAARLWVDTDRWRDVPFLLRTGKRLAASEQRVTLVLRRPDGPVDVAGLTPNTVSISLAGDGRIDLTTAVKRPGADEGVSCGTVSLDLTEVDPGSALPPYAAALRDVLEGERRLFTTHDSLEQAWRAFAPLLGPGRPSPHPYDPGSWGPAEADALAGDDGWQVS